MTEPSTPLGVVPSWDTDDGQSTDSSENPQPLDLGISLSTLRPTHPSDAEQTDPSLAYELEANLPFDTDDDDEHSFISLEPDLSSAPRPAPQDSYEPNPVLDPSNRTAPEAREPSPFHAAPAGLGHPQPGPAPPMQWSDGRAQADNTRVGSSNTALAAASPQVGLAAARPGWHAVPVSSQSVKHTPSGGRVTAPSEFGGIDSQAIARAQHELGKVLVEARRRAASDVHIVSDQPARTRVCGALEPSGGTIGHETVAAMVKGLLSPTHSQYLVERGYADLALDHADAGRVRINVCRQRTGLKVCFRLVRPTPPTLTDLGLPTEVQKLSTHHQGLAVISGPNGHGKTTTMGALIDLFNATRAMHIITVEDPVEIIHPVKKAIVSQREVGTHTKTFGSALKASLREDPDVIAIGELRDRETVEMALSAAETGHLVLATMSTPSGAKTIARLIDMFPPDDQSQVRATLAGALKLIVSQRLVQTHDGKLVAAYELITGNVPLWTLIRDNKLYQLPSLIQRGRAYGMVRLEDSLRDLVAAGTITEEEAIANAADPKALGPRTAGAGNPNATGHRRGLLGSR